MFDKQAAKDFEAALQQDYPSAKVFLLSEAKAVGMPDVLVTILESEFDAVTSDPFLDMAVDAGLEGYGDWPASESVNGDLITIACIVAK